MPADFCLAGQKIHSPIHTRRDIKQALIRGGEIDRWYRDQVLAPFGPPPADAGRLSALTGHI